MKSHASYLCIIFALSLMVLLASCKKKSSSEPDPGEVPPIEDISVAEGFDYSSLRTVDLQIRVQTLNNSPLPGVRVMTFADPFTEDNPQIRQVSGVTNEDGLFQIRCSLPAYQEKIYAQAGLIGGINRAEIAINGDQISHTFSVTTANNFKQANPKKKTSPRINLVHFPDPVITDQNMSVLIDSIVGIDVIAGAEIACLTPDGIVAAADYLDPEETQWGMALWGDDPSTDETDGFKSGEELKFVYWDPTLEDEIEAELTSLEGRAVFTTNGFLVITLIIEPQGKFRYLGPRDENGVPHDLDETNDEFDTGFVQRLSVFLPEMGNFPSINPSYMMDDVNIEFSDYAEVWVTFLHEGSSKKNTLGFYTYPAGEPPQSVNDIESLTIILPNTSFLGDGGGLEFGSRIKIGDLRPDKGIGWFLVEDGWDGQTVSDDNQIFFSNFRLNPENSNVQKRHSLIVHDQLTEKLIVAFEDTRRDEGSDHDFNDVVFAVTVTPSAAWIVEDIAHLTNNLQYPDRDADGIFDIIDAYPNMDNRAFDNYFPGLGQTGNIAFEDQWTDTDDYDFNDLVVSYNMNQITDGSNGVRVIMGDFRIKAIGSALNNGFGFEMPISPDQISQVSGHRISGGYINLAGNNLEAGQEQAVVIVVDDVLSLAQPAGGFSYVNTEPGSPQIAIETISIQVDMEAPVSFETIGSAPFNPFLIVNRQRGVEIHAVNYSPTSLADAQLFGGNHDRSNPDAGVYYKSDQNLPWALILPGEWRHMNESAALNQGYLNFGSWAESGGGSNMDWYLPEAGNINSENIWAED